MTEISTIFYEHPRKSSHKKGENMEIERKFLISDFPDLPLLRQAEMDQGYLCTHPVVRIRRSVFADHTTYVLCFKGKGTLARQEIEMPLTQEQYEQLCDLLPKDPVKKIFRVYQLPDGRHLECSIVDPGCPTSFLYAEVEFPSIKEALSWQPPAFLGKEMTEDPSFTMGAYWDRKPART